MARPSLCNNCGQCRRCQHAAYMRDWYRRPGVADKVRSWARRYAATHPDSRDRRPVNPDKEHARKAAWERLARPAKCEECGAPGLPCRDGRTSIQAHHEDYTQPLTVRWRWLCLK